MYLYIDGGGGLVGKTCATLAINPMDCSLPVSSVHRIQQGRIIYPLQCGMDIFVYPEP